MASLRDKKTKTRFSERKVFRSSVHIRLALNGAGKAPEFLLKPKRQFIDEGETARFKASFEGSSDTQINWTKNGKPVALGDRVK
ncbi:MYLK-like protein, partial [Mya arenaria]